MSWKDDANDLICELSDLRNDLDSDINALKRAIEANDDLSYFRIRDDYEERRL